MVARQKATRKRPFTDPTHRQLDELSHYKQAKTEVKSEAPTSSGVNNAASGLEDLENEISPFGKYLYL